MTTVHRYVPGILIAVATLTLAGAAQRSGQSAAYRSWSSYGGGPEQLRYSSLTQINRRNVANLEVAWTYDTGESGDLQTQPVVVGDILYAYSPNQRVLALDAATGKAVWTFDAKLQGAAAPTAASCIGPATAQRRRGVFAGVAEYLYALDAKNGTPIAEFGTSGGIDLRQDLGREEKGQSVRLTTPARSTRIC